MANRNTSGLKRGGPGRKPGIPNKASAEIKEIARRLLTDPKYVESLTRRLPAGKAPHMETLLHHYAYGKPKEEHEGTFTHLHKVYAWQE